MSNQDGNTNNASRLISAYIRLEEWMKNLRNKTDREGYKDSIDAIAKNEIIIPWMGCIQRQGY